MSQTHHAGKRVKPSTPSPSPNRLLLMLLAILIVAAIGLWISRHRMPSAPPPPEPNADLAMHLRYYSARIKADPTDSDAYVHLGRIDVERGYYLEALNCFRFAGRLGVPDKVIAEPMGRCYARLLRADEARDALHRAQAADPDSVDAAVDLADLESNFSGQSVATDVLHRFLAQHKGLLEHPAASDSAEILKLVSECTRTGDAADAIVPARSLIALAPQDANGYAFLARNLLVLRHEEEAATAAGKAVELAPDQSELHTLDGVALSRIPGRAADALPQLQQAVFLDSANGTAYRALGQTLALLKRWREAGAAYLHAATLQPDQNVELFQLAAQMARKAGDTMQAADCSAQADLFAGNYEDALRQLQVLVHSPVAAWHRRGLETTAVVYRRMNRRKDYLSLVKQFATGATAQDYGHLADAYDRMRDYNREAIYLKKALALDPLVAGSVHFHLGQIAQALGRRDEEESEYEAAVQNAPHRLEFRRALVQSYLTRLDVGDHLARAQQQAEQIVLSKAAVPEDFHTLGIIYKAAKRTQQAVQAVQHAVDLAPGTGSTYLDLGQLYQQIGNQADADTMLKFYRNAESLLLEQRNLAARANAEPGNPVAQAALGDFYAATQAYLEAGRQYRKAAALAPQNAQYHASLARVDLQLGLLDEASEQEALLPPVKREATH